MAQMILDMWYVYLRQDDGKHYENEGEVVSYQTLSLV